MTDPVKAESFDPQAVTSKQRKVLRGAAHSLKPVVQVGHKGLSATTLAEVEQALESHELIKVRIAGDRDERQHTIDRIGVEANACVVGHLGRNAIFFRASSDPKKRRVDPGQA